MFRKVLCVFLAIFFASYSLAEEDPSSKIAKLERRVNDLEKEIAKLKRIIDISFDPKEEITLFDKKIDLSKEDIRERFEREFFLLIERKGLLKILLKRYFKWKELIEKEIKESSLHEDLLFLALAESYLNPRAISPAQAAGLWQFIKETGKEEGLVIDELVDERYDIIRSTKAALLHIRRLLKEFDDDIFLAVAAYNVGKRRIKESIENQNSKNFFDLFLPEETERYIFRIAALKEILLNREKYGIFVVTSELYRPLKILPIKISVEKEIPITAISDAMGLTYKSFRDLNLHLRKYKLDKGTYYINVPLEKKSLFLKNLRKYPYIRIEDQS